MASPFAALVPTASLVVGIGTWVLKTQAAKTDTKTIRLMPYLVDFKTHLQIVLLMIPAHGCSWKYLTNRSTFNPVARDILELH
jgi:hypothetical protein